MARRVDQVQDIILPVAVKVEAHGLRFDRDAALALNIHIVEHLLFHLTLRETACQLDQAIR